MVTHHYMWMHNNVLSMHICYVYLYATTQVFIIICRCFRIKLLVALLILYLQCTKLHVMANNAFTWILKYFFYHISTSGLCCSQLQDLLSSRSQYSHYTQRAHYSTAYIWVVYPQ